jgi:alpha-beta hydrolase superfamily lysophospholipase
MQYSLRTKNIKINGIAATIHLPEIKNPPIIVMCHGFNSSKDSPKRIEIAENFCNNGFAVLRFDFYGHGKSCGKLEEFTISKGIENLQKVLDWIEEQKFLNSMKIGVQGSSLGGTIAILTAAIDKRIKCLVTWGSPIRFTELLTGEIVKNFEEKGFFELESGVKVGKCLYNDMKKYVIARAVEKINIPFLIIHGKKDDVVYFGNAEDIYKFAKGPKKLELIENAGHDLKNFSEAIDSTLSWFKRWLSD